MAQKFELGQVVMTRGIANILESNARFQLEVNIAFAMYSNGDWGSISEGDAELNEEALKIGDRLMACYPTCIGDIWIVTEWDRSVTTILLPEEY